MKVVKEEKNLLVLRENNLISYGLVAIFLVIAIQPRDQGGVTGVVIGLVLIAIIRRTTVILDKTKKLMLIESRSLIKQKTREYDLDQIKAIEVRKNTIIVAVMSDGQEVALNLEGSGRVALNGIGISGVGQLAGKVADFLEVVVPDGKVG